MKRNPFIRKSISLLLIICIVLISGCGAAQAPAGNGSSAGGEEQSQDVLPEKSQKDPANDIEKVEAFYLTSESGENSNLYENPNADRAFTQYRSFAIEDFKNTISPGSNEITSPLSFYYALAIMANGAKGVTRNQIENVLGMTVEDANQFLYELDKESFGYGIKGFNKANAIWFNTDLGQLEQEYKDTVTKYYGDSVFEDSFADKQRLASEVNQWSSRETDGGIENILDESDIKADSIILILNALTAGGNWMMQFDPGETRYEEFHGYNGSGGMVEMMHQTLYGFWETEDCTGFMKDIENGICFIALLPNEGEDIYDFINSMDSETIKELLDSYHTEDLVETTTVNTPNGSYESQLVDEHYTVLSFPKYSYDTEYDLTEVLRKFGLSDLLDYTTCDFSGISDQVYVQDAKQRATIEVDEEKATAAAVSVMVGGLGAGGPEVRNTYYHEVKFDRPFVYAFIDWYGNMPMFLGVVADIGEQKGEAFMIENIAGTINIRSIPSTKGEVVGHYELGQTVYAFETTTAEGYTWYRIGDGKWVADQNGEWIKKAD